MANASASDCAVLASVFPDMRFLANCCGNGIACSGTRVTGITIGCTAPIRANLALLPQFTALQTLDLGGCLIRGTLPAGLSALTGITTMDISGNRFSGDLPNLTTMTSLTYLNLKSNDFTTIPDLSSLSQLFYINLGGRTVSTPWPSWVTKLPNLEYMYMPNSNISGRIPDGISTMPKLRYLDLSSNQLTGEIPPSFAGASGLRYLDLSGNLLTGSIPDFIGGFKELEMMDLSSNSLSGPIPDSIFSLPVLNRLSLVKNHLTGSIPSKFSSMSGLARLSDLSGNSLLSGPLGSGPASLVSCSLANTQLCTTGSAPSICALPNCTTSQGAGNDAGGLPLNPLMIILIGFGGVVLLVVGIAAIMLFVQRKTPVDGSGRSFSGSNGSGGKNSRSSMTLQRYAGSTHTGSMPGAVPRAMQRESNLFVQYELEARLQARAEHSQAPLRPLVPFADAPLGLPRGKDDDAMSDISEPVRTLPRAPTQHARTPTIDRPFAESAGNPSTQDSDVLPPAGAMRPPKNPARARSPPRATPQLPASSQ
ncbi:hypothetical protein HK105_202208 [Polyrhizophydium stewartii]|uniref:L domain-like protein n=1 Tax=Polyrhizophydium stewartii TaxID=2732419 RepID=A0ABR4NFJ6_9FUNG